MCATARAATYWMALSGTVAVRPPHPQHAFCCCRAACCGITGAACPASASRAGTSRPSSTPSTAYRQRGECFREDPTMRSWIAAGDVWCPRAASAPLRRSHIMHNTDAEGATMRVGAPNHVSLHRNCTSRASKHKDFVRMPAGSMHSHLQSRTTPFLRGSSALTTSSWRSIPTASTRSRCSITCSSACRPDCRGLQEEARCRCSPPSGHRSIILQLAYAGVSEGTSLGGQACTWGKTMGSVAVVESMQLCRCLARLYYVHHVRQPWTW